MTCVVQVAREYIARLEPELYELRDKEEHERSRWEDENSRINASLEESTKTVASLRLEIEHVQVMLEKALAEKDASHKQHIAAKDDVESARAERQQVLNDLLAAKKESDRVTAEAEALKASLEKAIKDAKDQATILGAANKELETSRRRMQELDEEAAALKDTLARLTSQVH